MRENGGLAKRLPCFGDSAREPCEPSRVDEAVDAVARVREELEAEFETARREARRAFEAEMALRLAAAEREWRERYVVTLTRVLRRSLRRYEGALDTMLAGIFEPFVRERRLRRLVASCVDVVRNVVAQDRAATVTIRGPVEVGEMVRRALEVYGLSTEFHESADIDLSIAIDASVVRMKLGEIGQLIQEVDDE